MTTPCMHHSTTDPHIVGESRALELALEDARSVAATTTTVLLEGETGTGKELFARAIHDSSPRADKAMVTVNCAALPEHLVESELFGHERGAFTGAVQRRAGRFTLAHGGTLFLDEIGELPLALQAKLLRVLQEGEVTPLGGTTTTRVDVRVVAATHRDLAAEVRAGRFREDLFYRLRVFPLRLPALRERRDDIPLLTAAFVARLERTLGRRFAPLGEDELRKLSAHDWPGNVRELQAVLERAALTARGDRLNLDRALGSPCGAAHAPARVEDVPFDRILTATELLALERLNTVRALERTRWRVAGDGGAADLLGMPPSTLSSRMKALGIARPAGAPRVGEAHAVLQ
jgi:formate hydrogenlyase transcriptional activator